jgi:predicted ATPase
MRFPSAKLPGQVTSFVGREADLIALSAAVNGASIVTLHGPPGVGKTRLAAACARQSGGLFPGGTWFCDVSDAQGLDDVCGVVGHLLAVPLLAGKSTADATERIGSALAGRPRSLIVLDNFEHVVRTAAEAVRQWAMAAPHMTYLITSRERLRVGGEVLFEVGPLSLPSTDVSPERSEAVQLFVERTRASRRGYTLADDAAAVAELVQKLDGLPLAIELAAARMRVLTPAQLLEDATRRADVLSRRRRELGQRGTLWAAIDDSWSMLEAWHKTALARCSVFHGGFTVDAAEAVAFTAAPLDAPSTLDMLEDLVDRSLLISQPPAETGRAMRYAMLVSIREFVAERLADAGEVSATATRHASHYLRVCATWSEQVDAHGGDEARRRLEEEAGNLLAVHRRALASDERSGLGARQAVEAALALEPILSARGPHVRRVELLGSALALAGSSLEPVLRARGIAARAQALRMVGRMSESIADYELAASMADGAGDRKLLGRIWAGLAGTLWVVGRANEAAVYRERALSLHRAMNDRDWEGVTMSNQGIAALAEGRLDDARASLEHAIRLHHDVGDRRREAIDLNNLASVDEEEGLLPAARAHYEEALRIEREIGDRSLEAAIVLSLALLDVDDRRLDAGAQRVSEALGIARATGDRLLEGLALGQLGILLHDRGQLEEARQQYGRCVARLRQGSAQYEALYYSYLACLEAELGRVDEARASLHAADVRLRGTRHPTFEQVARLCRGRLELALAEKADRAGGRATAASHRREAALLLDEARAASAVLRGSVFVRWATRRLAQAIETGEDATTRGAMADGAVLTVSAEGCWFRPPFGQAARLYRRHPLRRVLKRLAEQRIHTPGVAVSSQTLLAVGWPGEIVDRQSGANRVYNALASLRKFGLRTLLLSRDDGYLIDPTVDIRIVPEPER